MAVLTTRKRKRLPNSAFTLPRQRKYPIYDKVHARNALARVAQHGARQEQAIGEAKSPPAISEYR
ncbi:hypothetical protein LCGC14_1835710 [marine sediment metagenome]|uniref:Uncharacterized protein n=1 Tax=marine sediment metagenome TaxID=412755 RepID=A0A0F9JEB3_9ZZZZ